MHDDSGIEASVQSERGLTASEARARLEEFGPNDPVPHRRGSRLHDFALLFLNPLSVILLVAAALSATVGQKVDASIIIIIVLLGVLLNFVQTWRSGQAVARLQQGVAATATVLRDGEWQTIPRCQVVPGDLVRLSAGDLVPADARLVKSRDLYVQQAALTGESLPAPKEACGAQGDELMNPAAPGLVFLGTPVVSGSAVAEVLATGPRTAFGGIATHLTARPQETEFDRGLRHFSLLILRAVIFFVLFVLTVNLALRHNPFESLLFAVALAVGLTPEFLPMITSVILARGAVQMARRKVIVKHLSAIQDFGSIDILCKDKTGTLTTGKMTLAESIDVFGNASERVALLARLNSVYQSGIQSPLDEAIQQGGSLDVRNYQKCDEIPFDFERRRLSVVLENGGKRLLITKGAPEAVLELAVARDEGGISVPLGDEARAAGRNVYEERSERGLRVIAVAWRHVDLRETYSPADECELTLAGFVTFEDPPLPDAASAIAGLKRDGVRIKIITGDNELVTRHICLQLGIDSASTVLGEVIEKTTDTALGYVAENAVVFARMSPAQKNRIILALRRRGHVVGYMGDGINDAPSLHTANVGISVSGATDVARDAADIILVERSLRVLHRGILEGRRAFANVTKYLLMGTSSNFGNMLSMAAASVMLPFLPMLPTQILLNNFLYDLAQLAIPTDSVDPEYLRSPHRWDIRMIRNFMISIGPISSLYDFLTFAVLLHVFRASPALFHTGWFVESLATQTLVLFVIRTMRNPLRSRPSRLLTLSTIAVVAAGVLLPFSPVAAALGFMPLPFSYFVFLISATATYLLLVEMIKRRLMPVPQLQAKK